MYSWDKMSYIIERYKEILKIQLEVFQKTATIEDIIAVSLDKIIIEQIQK